MERQHQFIYKKEQSKNGRMSPFTLALSLVIRVWAQPMNVFGRSNAMLALNGNFQIRRQEHRLVLAMHFFSYRWLVNGSEEERLIRFALSYLRLEVSAEVVRARLIHAESSVSLAVAGIVRDT